jgi:hypothetical protein
MANAIRAVMETFVKIIHKYGVTGLMACALLWFNDRLNGVEARLYDCYEDAATYNRKSLNPRTHDNSSPVYAVLPKEIKIESNDKELL